MGNWNTDNIEKQHNQKIKRKKGVKAGRKALQARHQTKGTTNCRLIVTVTTVASFSSACRNTPALRDVDAYMR